MSSTSGSTSADLRQLIADLERQLAECKAARDEALQRETATAEVLQVINSSPGDLGPVFDAILEKALRLCAAARGHVFRVEGDLGRAVAARGDAEFVEWLLKQGPVRPTPGGILHRMMQGERVVQIPDSIDTEGYRAGKAIRELIDRSGVSTTLGIALRNDSALLGAIFVNRREVRPFSDKEIALLQNFATQAVIAMENARLLTETREALEQQTATAEVLQVINSSPGDLAPVFDAVLEKAVSLSEAVYGHLWRFDGEHFHPWRSHGDPQFARWFEHLGPVRPNPDGDGFLGRVVRGENVLYIADVRDTEAYRTGYAPVTGLADVGGGRSVLTVALGKDHAVLGVLTVYRREVKQFSEKQISLLQNFAAQAVIAIENARLLTETREALEQQTATAEVLQVINSSPGDLAPVFDAMLEKAMNLCEAAFGGLFVLEGEQFRAVATRGLPRSLNDFVRRGFTADKSNPLLRGAMIDHIADLSERPLDKPGLRAAVELGGARTMLNAALRKDDTMLGSFSIFRREVRPFSDKQIALLQNFAAQAVIAMENARLLDELRQRTDQVAELNRGLEARVAEQVEELGRVGRLRRFLAPQVAELLVSQGDEGILESHRREIVVVFCDVRGYTAFTETAEPEEVLNFLREYHGALGPLVSQHEGTLDQFSGDGIMVFFNDPVPCPDPAERAVKMAMAMREAAGKLIAAWRSHGCELGFGAGIAQGYATLGQIGFAERSGYTAIGTVCNLAARLCAEAKDGQILVSSRVAGAVGAVARLEDLGNLELKGLHRPVAAFNVVQSINSADARPNLTVVAKGPGA